MYQQGVAMGGELEVPGGRRSSPRFFAQAVADAGGTGALLDRMQVVKGWVDVAGAGHERVFDLATASTPGAVDEATCASTRGGEGSMCASWWDPEFDPAQAAYYYLRVLETPTCRWSWSQCLAAPAAERPAECDDPNVPRTIRERAWSSPIWVTPSGG
jgi:hypothetical protein